MRLEGILDFDKRGGVVPSVSQGVKDWQLLGGVSVLELARQSFSHFSAGKLARCRHADFDEVAVLRLQLLDQQRDTFVAAS